MNGDSGISIFLGIAFLLFYLFISKGSKKKKEEEEIHPLPSLPPLQEKKTALTQVRKVEKKVFIESSVVENLASTAYDIVKTKKNSVLQPGWNKKSSIRQAFILAEVLKKVDER